MWRIGTKAAGKFLRRSGLGGALGGGLFAGGMYGGISDRPSLGWGAGLAAGGALLGGLGVRAGVRRIGPMNRALVRPGRIRARRQYGARMRSKLASNRATNSFRDAVYYPFGMAML